MSAQVSSHVVRCAGFLAILRHTALDLAGAEVNDLDLEVY